MPYEDIKLWIIKIDEANLHLQTVEQLIKFMPEPDQMNQIAGLKDQYKDMAEAEQFAVVVRGTFVHSLSQQGVRVFFGHPNPQKSPFRTYKIFCKKFVKMAI